MTLNPTTAKPPRGLRWRSSSWFVTLIVGLGVSTDLLVYSIIIPVLPFRLEALGYTEVSSLVGWLLFAYSGGLLFSTIPIAIFSERYAERWWPLIFGLIFLLAAEVLLMEAPNYAMMCVARMVQGVSSSVVWVVGLALLCDSTPERNIGRQLGFAVMGTSLGLVVGPPIAGLLYERLGYRAPFIFSIIWTATDLFGRMLVIERKEAIKWGYDPAAAASGSCVEDASSIDQDDTRTSDAAATSSAIIDKSEGCLTDKPNIQPKQLSLPSVVVKLLGSPRAVVALFLSVAFGTVWTGLETAMPLHLQAAWGLGSSKVGLVLLAGVLPMLLSSPLAGWCSDVKGAEWASALMLLGGLPWWGLMIVRSSLILFTIAFAFATFFTTAVVSPVTAELAAVSRDIKGVGYGHVYGAFNIAYGIGTAVGPIIAGQMYGRISRGWLAVCCLDIVLIAVCVPLSFAFTGDRPLLGRIMTKGGEKKAQAE